MPEKDVYEMVLEQVPVSLNVWQNLHWRRRADLRVMWQWEMLAVGPRIPKHNNHVRLSANIWFAVNCRRDVDNYAAVLWKMTQDGLVRMDIIPDDTPGYVTTGIVDLRVDPDKHEHTVICLEVS